MCEEWALNEWKMNVIILYLTARSNLFIYKNMIRRIPGYGSRRRFFQGWRFMGDWWYEIVFSSHDTFPLYYRPLSSTSTTWIKLKRKSRFTITSWKIVNNGGIQCDEIYLLAFQRFSMSFLFFFYISSFARATFKFIICPTKRAVCRPGRLAYSATFPLLEGKLMAGHVLEHA